jgi:hypothetical protein
MGTDSSAVSHGRLALILNPLHFVWWPLSMLACLVNHGGGQEFAWVELANREAVEPRLAAADEAPGLRASDVPLGDIGAVRSALAEEDDGHEDESMTKWHARHSLWNSPAHACAQASPPGVFIVLVPAAVPPPPATEHLLVLHGV